MHGIYKALARAELLDDKPATVKRAFKDYMAAQGVTHLTQRFGPHRFVSYVKTSVGNVAIKAMSANLMRTEYELNCSAGKFFASVETCNGKYIVEFYEMRKELT